MSPAEILLIEDTPARQQIYLSLLKSAGRSVTSVTTAAAGLTAFRQQRHLVVVVNIALPDRDGLDLVRDLLAVVPGTPIIAITSDRSVSLAVKAMRSGASELLVSPFDQSRFLQAIDKALRTRRGSKADQQDKDQTPPGTFLGKSTAMEAVYKQIRSAAASHAPVFITGEIGTGKELCGKTIHELSARSSAPFVKVNCCAISSAYFETGQHLNPSQVQSPHRSGGAGMQIRGATLYLDEICDTPLALQGRLVQVLQGLILHPTQTASSPKAPTRVICSTKHDPRQAVAEGRLSKDLFYLLHVIAIHMPPLRDRGDDVVLIAEHALRQSSREEGRQFTGLDADVAESFKDFSWQGNVRELLNLIHGIVVSHEGPTVTRAMLPSCLFSSAGSDTDADVSTNQSRSALDSLVGLRLSEIERRIIERTIAETDGSIAKAARILDVAPSTIYRKMEAWGTAPAADRERSTK